MLPEVTLTNLGKRIWCM